jgi:hypothetical protein
MHEHRLFAHQSIQAEVEIGPNAVPPVATIQISAIIQPSPATTVSPREVDIGAIDDAMCVLRSPRASILAPADIDGPIAGISPN